MSTTSLVAEFIVAGLVPFLALVFGALALFNVRDLTGLIAFKDYAVLVTLLLTLAIYLLGALMHRLSQLLVLLLHFDLSGERSEEERYQRQAYFYQHAAGPLIQRVEYEKSLERVFGSTTFTFLLLGVALCFWVREVANLAVALVSLAMCLVLALLAGLSFLRQHRNREALEDAFLALEHYPPPDH